MTPSNGRTTFRPASFRCNVRIGRASAVVELRGELDIATVDEVRVPLQELIATGRNVTIDLRRLGFIDSCGLQLILQTDALARRNALNLTLVRGPAIVQRLFAITGMDAHLAFVDPPEDLSAPG